jgi:hypothetical protein
LKFYMFWQHCGDAVVVPELLFGLGKAGTALTKARVTMKVFENVLMKRWREVGGAGASAEECGPAELSDDNSRHRGYIRVQRSLSSSRT